MQNLSLIELFSGIGCQRRGIENTNLFNITPIATSEIDKDAIVSYAAIHCNMTKDMITNYNQYPSIDEMISELTDKNIGFNFELNKPYNWDRLKTKDEQLKKYWLANHLTNNMGDISKIGKLPYCDVLTFSFPCTDISSAGQQKGLSYDDWKANINTRSGLVWEVIRLLKEYKKTNTLPKILLLENVSALISNKFINDFNKLNELINEIEYNVYYKVINAKECGIPQNRERLFAIYINKDIDNSKITFPMPFDNGLKTRDIIEKEVDSRYYITNKQITIFDKTLSYSYIGDIHNTKGTFNQRSRIFGINSFIGCLTATDYKTPKMILLNSDISDYDISNNNYKLRYLTPIECFKFMGFNKEDCMKAIDVGISNTQLYRQAGNGIVTNCIEYIFEHIYKALYDNSYICKDEKYCKQFNANYQSLIKRSNIKHKKLF